MKLGDQKKNTKINRSVNTIGHLKHNSNSSDHSSSSIGSLFKTDQGSEQKNKQNFGFDKSSQQAQIKKRLTDSFNENDHLYEAEYDIMMDKLEQNGSQNYLNIDKFDCESFASDFSVQSYEDTRQKSDNKDTISAVMSKFDNQLNFLMRQGTASQNIGEKHLLGSQYQKTGKKNQKNEQQANPSQILGASSTISQNLSSNIFQNLFRKNTDLVGRTLQQQQEEELPADSGYQIMVVRNKMQRADKYDQRKQKIKLVGQIKTCRQCINDKYEQLQQHSTSQTNLAGKNNYNTSSKMPMGQFRNSDSFNLPNITDVKSQKDNHQTIGDKQNPVLSNMLSNIKYNKMKAAIQDHQVQIPLSTNNVEISPKQEIISPNDLKYNNQFQHQNDNNNNQFIHTTIQNNINLKNKFFKETQNQKHSIATRTQKSVEIVNIGKKIREMRNQGHKNSIDLGDLHQQAQGSQKKNDYSEMSNQGTAGYHHELNKQNQDSRSKQRDSLMQLLFSKQRADPSVHNQTTEQSLLNWNNQSQAPYLMAQNQAEKKVDFIKQNQSDMADSVPQEFPQYIQQPQQQTSPQNGQDYQLSMQQLINRFISQKQAENGEMLLTQPNYDQNVDSQKLLQGSNINLKALNMNNQFVIQKNRQDLQSNQNDLINRMSLMMSQQVSGNYLNSSITPLNNLNSHTNQNVQHSQQNANQYQYQMNQLNHQVPYSELAVRASDGGPVDQFSPKYQLNNIPRWKSITVGQEQKFETNLKSNTLQIDTTKQSRNSKYSEMLSQPHLINKKQQVLFSNQHIRNSQQTNVQPKSKYTEDKQSSHRQRQKSPKIKRDIKRMNEQQLFSAICKSKWNQIEALLDIVDNVEARDKEGNTFINVAAQCGNYAVVNILAGEHYANVNTQNHLGNTPLHYAIAYKYNGIKELLIDRFQADENIKNKWKLTPWQGIGATNTEI